jgi:hypothetical protein
MGTFARDIHDWTDTTLWQLLEKSTAKEADRVTTALPAEMGKLQSVLAQGGTSPTDFTLHDAQHSFRVAQRMLDLMPPATVEGLSPYELALLLLAAYLHDIGMSPPQSLLRRLTAFVLLGTKEELTDNESSEFLDWIDGLDTAASELLAR